MLSLPSKPWKRVSLSPLGDGRYRLTVLSPPADAAAFERFVRDDVLTSLASGDRVEQVEPDTRSVIVAIERLDRFQRGLAFQSVIVEQRP